MISGTWGIKASRRVPFGIYRTPPLGHPLLATSMLSSVTIGFICMSLIGTNQDRDPWGLKTRVAGYSELYKRAGTLLGPINRKSIGLVSFSTYPFAAFHKS